MARHFLQLAIWTLRFAESKLGISGKGRPYLGALVGYPSSVASRLYRLAPWRRASSCNKGRASLARFVRSWMRHRSHLKFFKFNATISSSLMIGSYAARSCSGRSTSQVRLVTTLVAI